MGDETDGSSMAAQGAPDIEENNKGGLLGRLIGAFRAPDPIDEQDQRAEISATGTTGALSPLGMANLRRMRVEDVAVPKVEIVAVPLDISKDDLVKVFRDSGMTRLPVFDGTLDTPVGLIHLKDFALEHGFNGPSTDFALRPMVRPLLYAPPSMPIGVLLQKMQNDRMHMALVIDEYGGVDGLVTIEDLIEQVIGEIEDEHDIAEGSPWVEEKPGIYLVQARAPLDEFEAKIGIKLADEEDEEEIDTMGGLVFMMTGRVPTRGEVVPHDSGAEFEVVDADPRRIKRLRVRLPEAKDG
ncbi:MULTISPECIES: hemolysin family protein [Actibacterium]|uniref:Magnesium and cobalt transporter n=1 Tax=Actibacterium naphthalenivorans TaxID=1614693 RepID=A0A840C640_9RHOB|nr:MULTISPECIES: hemolysin family protein [Actibacterium]ALG89455.1 conjugal transfer protein [Actibacterium sp. EMB200-NS6]MBB4020915.1 magnesium and cobalt transporter [Actibacterium naphthalenivorans]